MFTEIVSLAVAVSGSVAHPGGDCFANRYTGDTYVAGNEWYCGVVPSEGVAVKDADNKVVNPATPVITVETTEETQEPVQMPVETPVVVITEDKKPKCNNGEGNGAEGCSPANSDNANNDENQTTPKEDNSHK